MYVQKLIIMLEIFPEYVLMPPFIDSGDELPRNTSNDTVAENSEAPTKVNTRIIPQETRSNIALLRSTATS